MGARTIADKLLITSASSIWLSDEARLALVGPLPDGATVMDRLDQATTALVFAESEAGLRTVLERERDRLTIPAALWIAYPKANRADINRDSLWPILTEFGLRPISQVAIDEVWSALRFRALREGEPPFSGGR